MFGMPTEDDGSRTDALLGPEHARPAPHYQPDIAALRAASTTMVVAVGEGPAGSWRAVRAKRSASGSA